MSRSSSSVLGVGSSTLVLVAAACAARPEIPALDDANPPVASAASAEVAPAAAAEATPQAGPEAARCREGADLGEPVELPTGFRVRLPKSWTLTAQPYGIVARHPDGHTQVALSGTFPSADLEHQKRLVETSTADMKLAHDWHEEERGGVRVVSRVMGQGAKTTAIVFLVAAKGHVLATIDSIGKDIGCLPVTAAILDTLDVGAPFDPSKLRSDFETCPSSIADVPANGGVCLDGAVLGTEVVDRCGRALESLGWSRADAVGQGIPGSTESRHCYASPP